MNILVALSGISVILVAVNQSGISPVTPPLERVAQALGFAGGQYATGPDRLELDAVSWEHIVRSPIYGVGLDVESNASTFGGVGVHNMFLFVWVGAGVLGFIGLMMMTASIGASYVIAYLGSRTSRDRLLIFALGTAYLAFLLYSLSAPILFIRYGWVPVALLVPLRAVIGVPEIHGQSASVIQIQIGRLSR
jgi:O-antigen ligase